jgi:hypothetical protein
MKLALLMKLALFFIHACPPTSCKATIWDPHWDPRLRRLIHDFLLEAKADVQTCAVFEAAECTTLEAAKELTAESSCLKGFPATQRAKFLQELEAKDVNSGLRPFLPNQSIEHLREWPPDISRALYVLVNDSTILLADPLGLLNKQLHEHYHNRLSDAKLLTKDSACAYSSS